MLAKTSGVEGTSSDISWNYAGHPYQEEADSHYYQLTTAGKAFAMNESLLETPSTKSSKRDSDHRSRETDCRHWFAGGRISKARACPLQTIKLGDHDADIS